MARHIPMCAPGKCEDCDRDTPVVGSNGVVALLNATIAERDRLAAENEKLREAMTRLRDAGALMSNLCFNWAQNTERFSDRERQQMDGMRRDWDSVTAIARAALARRDERGEPDGG